MDSLAIVSEPPTEMPVGDVIGTRRIGRILVAEDDVHMRRLVARALRTTGYRVVEAADGVEVLSRIESTIWHDRHDVIRAVVADMNMPGLTGLDVLAALRCAEVDTPFILITAYGDANVRREARALGAAAVIDKPFGLGESSAPPGWRTSRSAGAPRPAAGMPPPCPNGTERRSSRQGAAISTRGALVSGETMKRRPRVCRGCASSPAAGAVTRSAESLRLTDGHGRRDRPMPGLRHRGRRHHGDGRRHRRVCQHGCTDIAFLQPALRSSHGRSRRRPPSRRRRHGAGVADRVTPRANAVSSSGDTVRARRSVVLLV
jgi:CheY-like chemotaxis protein